MTIERGDDDIRGLQFPWFSRKGFKAKCIFDSVGHDDPTVVPAV